MVATASPAVRPGPVPALSSLERKVLGARVGTFAFAGTTCVATTTPSQMITLTGVARLRPTLVVDGHERIGGRQLEVRFIGNKIYIYLAEIGARDGGKPWLASDLKGLNKASGLDFAQLLNQVRELSPSGPSPLAKAASQFTAKGQATIRGQTVYAYSGSFGPSDLTKLGLPGALGKQTAAKLKQLGATEEKITTYITADGVALRTVVALVNGSKLLTASVSGSARLKGPVHVSAPPAGKTIDYNKIAGASG